MIASRASVRCGRRWTDHRVVAVSADRSTGSWSRRPALAAAAHRSIRVIASAASAVVARTRDGGGVDATAIMRVGLQRLCANVTTSDDEQAVSTATAGRCQRFAARCEGRCSKCVVSALRSRVSRRRSPSSRRIRYAFTQSRRNRSNASRQPRAASDAAGPSRLPE